MQKEQETWDEIKALWNSSSHIQELEINLSILAKELMDKSSLFEQNSIKNDIQYIKGSITQFEKESIKKDIQFIKKYSTRFEKNFLKSGISFINRILKKIITKIKGRSK